MSADRGSTAFPEVVQFGKRHNLSGAAQEELQGLMSASLNLTSKRVTVAVPASVAHLGPGLDSCGLALDIWDEITVEYGAEFDLELAGNCQQVPRSREQNLAAAGVASAFASMGREAPAVRMSCVHRIPWGRGLGAESASFVGGFLAGRVLCGEEVSALAGGERAPSAGGEATPGEKKNNVDIMLQAAIARGWSVGNVCPAIFGALQIGVETPTGVRSHRVPAPNGIVCALFVPDESKEGLPMSTEFVERKAAVFNVGHMALLINCFCSGNFDMFAKAMEDTVSQEHCASQFPWSTEVIKAATAAGASGACLCGYGPSVFALITGRTGDVLAQSSSNDLERSVARAMLAKADEGGVPGRVLIAKPADIGAHVVAQKSELGIEGNDRIIYFQ